MGLEADAYAHLDLAQVEDAILQLDLGSLGDGEQTDSSDGDDHGSLTLLGEPRKPSASSKPLRVVVRDESGTLEPRGVLAMLQVILQARLKVANRIVNDEWSIDGSQLMQAVLRAARPPAIVGGLDDQLRNLPMEPTRMNVELVRIHLQLLSRFKTSIDGNPDPESRFMKHWIPLSLKNPLLLHIVLYTASCFLNETGRVPKMLVWAYKGAVHRMLNDQLRSGRTQTSDAAIMGTTQMVVDSWYWGTTEEVRAHMAGLKTMVRLRGGPQALGMQGFLAKTVLIHDIAIALAHDLEPTMYGLPGFDFRDEFLVPYQVSFNSPLLRDWPPFACTASKSRLKVGPLSAAILDDMRSVITTVVSLPHGRQITGDLQFTVESAARRGFERLKAMPAEATAHEAGDAGLMYDCVRETACIYYRAILSRRPTTEVMTAVDFHRLWDMVWGVTLSRWSKALGIFMWILVAMVPRSHQTQMARFIKTSMVTGFMMMGLENWHVAMNMAQAGLRLQRWLRGGNEEEGGREEGVLGGESVVDKHGFLFSDAVPQGVGVQSLPLEDEDEEGMY